MEKTRPAHLLVLIVALAGCVLANAAPDSREADLGALLDGVTQIARPGVPGPILAFGPEAFAIVQDRQRDGSGSPIVAATRLGKGRVVLFGHGGYMGAKALKTADTARLMANAVRWAGGGSAPVIVGVDERYEKTLRPLLEKAGHKVVRIEISAPGKVDVVAARTWGASPAERATLNEFVRGGGGILSAGLGWGWKQLNPGKDLAADYPPNLLFMPMGLMFADGTTKATSPKGYDARKRPSPYTSAFGALDTLRKGGGKLSKEGLAQVGATLCLAEQNLPESDTLFRPRLAALFEGRTAPVPSPDKPIKLSDAFGRLALARETRKLQTAQPGELKAHPAARYFPGPVPEDAPRVTRTFEIDAAVPRWHSTGLYAAPGEVIRVAIPASATDQKLRVRIGAHKDGIWQRDKWKRLPAITRTYRLKSEQTQAACAFGGLIYIEVPKKAATGAIPVRIENAIEAPLFVLGATKPEAWRETIRNRPAPWGELASGKIILTIPAERLRAIDDPTELLGTWDRVMDACADLAARPRTRQSPERFVPDIQISAGYMHSGYPLMCHLPQSADMVDLDKLQKGRWGFFHEIGHNHQNRDWTFSGTTEVTVNLFTLYVYDTVCGIPPRENERFSPEKRAKKLAQFRKDGKKPPFTFLLMYVQMQEAFGWDFYKDLFAEYRDLPKSERPKSDDEKRDQWLVRASKRAGRNLGPFFEAWKVPTSEAARRSVANLPAWMPNEMAQPRIATADREASP